MDTTVLSKLGASLATKVYRDWFPYLIAASYFPQYLLKYRKYHALEQLKEGFSDHREWLSRQPDTENLVQRLVTAYLKAKTAQNTVATPYQVGSLWQEILNLRFGDLIGACNNQDIARVQGILSNFHREDCGVDTGGGGQYHKKMGNVPFYRYQYASTWYMWYETCVKYLGHEPSFSLDPIGNPVGLCLGDCTIPIGHIEYYCNAHKIAELVKNTKNPAVCEIGGGVGGQAYEVLRHGIPGMTYTIFDIPEVVLLSSYFLMLAFPDKKFQLYAEDFDNPDISMLPNFALDTLPDNAIDLFFNSCSFSEMNYHTMEEYIHQIERICRRYLLHVNHDARIVRYENNNRITNMIASEVLPDPTLFRQVYQKDRMFFLPEDVVVIKWFYRVGHYEFLYERRNSKC